MRDEIFKKNKKQWGIEVDNKRERAVSTMCLCFLSALSFCSRVSVYKVW